MASGTIDLSQVKTSSTYNTYFQGRIIWSSSSNGSLANSSSVYCDLYARKYNSSEPTRGVSWNGYVSIDGETFSFSQADSNLSIGNDWVKIKSYSKTVYHNSSGTKSIVIAGSITGPSGTTLGKYTSSGSQTVTLDTIPRYPSVNQSLRSVTETSISMNWSSDSTCDYVWYRYKRYGSSYSWSSWYAYGSVNASSGYYTITGLSANTEYQIQTRLRRKDSQLTADFPGDTITTTYSYASIRSTPDFTVGNNFTISLNNASSRSCRIYIIAADGTSKEVGTTSGTSITVTNSSSWESFFYNSIPRAKNGRYKVRLVCSAASVDTTVTGGIYTVVEDKIRPTFTASYFNYEDVNPKTLALTGDKSVVIKSVSTVRVNVTTDAVPQYGASNSYYNINGRQYEYKTKFTTDISYFEDSSVKIFAIDSRNISSSPPAELPVNLINYQKLERIEYSYSRNNTGIGPVVTFNLKGKWWDNSFGDTPNTLSASYTYTNNKTSTTKTGTTSITLDTESEKGVFSFSGILYGDTNNGFDSDTSYTVNVRIKDKLTEVVFTYIVIEGEPAIALYGNNIALGRKYNTDLGGRVQILGNNIIGETVAQINGGYGMSTVSTGNTDLEGNSVVSSGSAWESLSTSEIVVKEGIRKLLVSFHSYFSNSGEYQVTINIDCGGKIVQGIGVINDNGSLTIPPVLVELDEDTSYIGDRRISADMNIQLGSASRAPYLLSFYLTVQVVE